MDLSALSADVLWDAFNALVANPLVIGAVGLVLGARVLPSVFAAIKRSIGRG